MSAEWGALKEPSAYVPPAPGGQTKIQQRADRHADAEGLGRWGAERWEPPGFGDSGPRCGLYQPMGVCSGCGDLALTEHICGRRSCPDCWTSWAKKAAVRITRRIQAFRYTQPDGPLRQVAHGVVSPPDGAVRNRREFWDGRSTAAEIAQEKGWRGFCVIGHPWRYTEEAAALYNAADPDYGIWVWLRKDVSEERFYELTRWSPHYHIIGATSPDMDPGEESDAWTYKFIRSMDPMESIYDTEAHQDLYGAVRYLLSHVGYPEESTKQTTTWYGDLANSVFVEDATEDWQQQKPSPGVLSKLTREIEAVADVQVDDDREAGEDARDDLGDCRQDDCDGVYIDVFDVPMYLEGNDPPPGVAARMMAAWEWRLGDRVPPPGMKNPQTEEQAREAFESLITSS